MPSVDKGSPNSRFRAVKRADSAPGATRRDAPSRNLLLWAWVQVYLFGELLVTLAIYGVAKSIYTRQFSWRAFVGALLLIWAQFGIIFIIVFSSDAPLRGWRELLLWGGSIGALGVAGFAAGVLGRRVGVWECYLASLITLALIWVHLAKGWHVLLDFGAADTETYLDFISNTPPGPVASSRSSCDFMECIWYRSNLSVFSSRSEFSRSVRAVFASRNLVLHARNTSLRYGSRAGPSMSCALP